MVLVLHLYFSMQHFYYLPADTSWATLCANIFSHKSSIVSVNVFVLISGWFGIRFSNKGFWGYIFQVLYISVGLSLPFFITGKLELSRENILSEFTLLKNAYWFVWAYILLYILAPILNSFADNSDQKTFKRTLVLYFIFETIIAIFTRLGFFGAGYHPFAFIGLYLLARYLRIYPPKIENKYFYLAIYITCVLINSLTDYILTKKLYIYLNGYISSYINPFNIVGAAALVIFFSKLNIKSRLINWVASSCFAVYLVHLHFCIFPYYKQGNDYIVANYSGIKFIAVVALFFIGVYTISVLLDKPRIVLFNAIWKRIGTKS